MPKVRLTRPLVHGDSVLETGTLLEVDAHEQDNMIRSGRATPIIRVRALEPDLIVSGRVLAVGDEAETTEGIAIKLHNHAQAEILDPDQIADRTRMCTPQPYRRIAPRDEYAEAPKARVKVLKEFFDSRRTHAAGDIAEVPDFSVVRGVKSGCLKVLDQQGMRDDYVRELRGLGEVTDAYLAQFFRRT